VGSRRKDRHLVDQEEEEDPFTSSLLRLLLLSLTFPGQCEEELERLDWASGWEGREGRI
jgi:hypothetical protein